MGIKFLCLQMIRPLVLSPASPGEQPLLYAAAATAPTRSSEIRVVVVVHNKANKIGGACEESFYIGQKIQALSEDDQLQPGHNYFLLPKHFFHSVLSFVTIASSFASSSKQQAFLKKAASCGQAFDIQRTPSGSLQIRVSDEFIPKLMEEGNDEMSMNGNPSKAKGMDLKRFLENVYFDPEDPIIRDASLGYFDGERIFRSITPTPGGDDADPHLHRIDSTENIFDLPDECLAYIFRYLGSIDLKSCSLIYHHWLRIEGQSRHCPYLSDNYNLPTSIPFLFTRFDAVTTLILRTQSIDDDTLFLISLHRLRLTCSKLRSCNNKLINAGMKTFSVNCKGLKKFSCQYCNFGANGINAVLDHCSSLENLSVKHLTSLLDKSPTMPIGPGVAASSLKTICIKNLHNGLSFGSLIIGSKNLRTLKIINCFGDWNKFFALSPTSNLSNLEIFYLLQYPKYTNASLASITHHRKILSIGDEGLTSIAKGCPKLQELVLCGV
ncbi:F-box protein At1g47056-like [Telopea speciosissima]|uniref:F-box protein At1g47056-like n=1 Tax=Telopea speciosissima TaxID=54955 RepID=UPI001CC608F6|nr:F-box protein At1g47056-like [Telopea speciosissima]